MPRVNPSRRRGALIAALLSVALLVPFLCPCPGGGAGPARGPAPSHDCCAAEAGIRAAQPSCCPPDGPVTPAAAVTAASDVPLPAVRAIPEPAAATPPLPPPAHHAVAVVLRV
jgi:hypothetical protein